MTKGLNHKALATFLSATLAATGAEVSCALVSPAYAAEDSASDIPALLQGDSGPDTSAWAPCVSEAGPLPASIAPPSRAERDADPEPDPAAQSDSEAPETAEAAPSVQGILPSGDDAVLVREPLPAPAIVQAANAPEGVAVAWAPLKNAETIYLQRKAKGQDGWEVVAELPGDADTYLDASAEPGVRYAYRLRARSAQDSTASPYSGKLGVRRLLAPTGVAAQTSSRGVRVTWERADGAGAYAVYRRAEGTSSWEPLGQTASGTTCWWEDRAAANGVPYRYRVAAVRGASESAPSAEVVRCFVNAPKVKALKRKSADTYLVKWSRNRAADGYQVQYSTSGLFAGKKTVKIADPAEARHVLEGLKSGKTYYARVRAYVKLGGKIYYSAWALSPNAAAKRAVEPKRLSLKGQPLELRELAGQQMFGFDTVQGSCTDGTYGYYCLYNRDTEKCRIAKVELADRKVVKVSRTLSLAHGNDITYDSTRKRLVVVHTTKNGKRLSIVSPRTLKVRARKNLKVPKVLPGATDAQRKAVTGMSGIAYNAKRDQYVACLSGSHDFLVLDGKLRPVRYIKVSRTSDQVYQGIDATNDYIVAAVSPRDSGRSNMLLAYDWDGKLVSRVKLEGIDEVESIYHVGAKFYASVYRSYHKVEAQDGEGEAATPIEQPEVLARDNYVYYLPGL